MEREVFLFETDEGVEPFAVFLKSIQNKNAKSQVIAAVTKMGKGLFGDYKAVGDGVQEFRLHGEGYRIYFYFDGPVMVVLLGGSDKRTQAREIAKAKEYLKEYKAQKRKKTIVKTLTKKGEKQ